MMTSTLDRPKRAATPGRSMTIYEDLGVRPLINAGGTVTRLGGTLMAPEVLRAMVEAADAFVDLSEFLSAAGERIAGLLGAPAAHITSGAAAGMSVAAAACMAGTDKAKVYRLPDTDGLKNEILVHRCHRNVYDQPIRMAGARLVEFCHANKVESWQLAEAITDRTAALFYYVHLSDHGTLPFGDIVAACRQRDVPVVVNAASELPPPELIAEYLASGADLVICSGGKDLCGPQGTGVILGRRDLVTACAANSNPNYSIGRPFKVAKEEIAGLVKAVELYVELDHAQRAQAWMAKCDAIMQMLNDMPGFSIELACPGAVGGRPAHVPRIYIRVSPGRGQISLDRIATSLRAGEPSIAVGVERDRLIVNPQCLREGEEVAVAEALRGCLEAAIGTEA